MRALLVMTLIAGIVGLASCKKSPPTPQPDPAESSAPSAVVVAQPSASVPDLASAGIEVDGLKAVPLPNGQVHVTGVDKWGGKLDVTYENAKFFRDALPVLSRSVTESQAAALQKLADTLPR